MDKGQRKSTLFQKKTHKQACKASKIMTIDSSVVSGLITFFAKESLQNYNFSAACETILHKLHPHIVLQKPLHFPFAANGRYGHQTGHDF
jgi:hypothetical protein